VNAVVLTKLDVADVFVTFVPPIVTENVEGEETSLFGARSTSTKLPVVLPEELNPKFGRFMLVGVTVPLSSMPELAICKSREECRLSLLEKREEQLK
jgi:hypothetical protein